tara:strand:+ start:211 stop:522 length:312 start_codon:yes stop_codon:yes gene_type:complete
MNLKPINSAELHKSLNTVANKLEELQTAKFLLKNILTICDLEIEDAVKSLSDDSICNSVWKKFHVGRIDVANEIRKQLLSIEGVYELEPSIRDAVSAVLEGNK